MRTLWKPVMGLLCTVSMTSMAQAQDAQDSDAPEREVIIVTATLRANRSRVSNTLTTVDDDTGVLEAKPKESFTYTSLNPAVGITQQVGTGLAVFANLARNTRVPTVIELGCADPAEPCRLPVGLQSDPYLKQVRATSLEALAKLKGVVRPDGTVTAGNASGVNDGACALILANEASAANPAAIAKFLFMRRSLQPHAQSLNPFPQDRQGTHASPLSAHARPFTPCGYFSQGERVRGREGLAALSYV